MLSLCLFQAFMGGCKLPYFISCLFSSPRSTVHPHLPSRPFRNLYIFPFFFLYSPTINTLTVIYFLLLKTEIVFAVILPRSNLSFLSQGKSYYDSAVSPRVDLVQQWDCDFFDSLVMEAAMKSLAYAANTEVVTVRGKEAGLGDPLERETHRVSDIQGENIKAILPLFVSHIVTAPKRQLVAFS